MKYIFYLGSLKINFETEKELSLPEFDKCFQNQILLITKEVNVQIVNEQLVEIPQNCHYHKHGLKVYLEDNKEVRIYNAKHKYEIASVYDSNSTVKIYLPPVMSINANKLRPWFHIHLEELLLHNQAMVLHSASIKYNNDAILFSGPSGSGKTTQTNLWHKYKDNIFDINGDRTLLQLIENRWYACGFPIYGSTVRCEQIAVPLKAIVYLKQGECNTICEMTKKEKFFFLYKEITTLTFNHNDANQFFELLDNLIERITIIQLTCQINQNAVSMLHEYLYKGV